MTSPSNRRSNQRPRCSISWRRSRRASRSTASAPPAGRRVGSGAPSVSTRRRSAPRPSGARRAARRAARRSAARRDPPLGELMTPVQWIGVEVLVAQVPPGETSRDSFLLGGTDQIGGAVEDPVPHDRDVDALVAADVAAVVRVAVARVPDDVPVDHDRAARVAEAAAPSGARVVLVGVRLEDLSGELLADLSGVPTYDRLAHGGRRLRAGVRPAHLRAVSDREELGAVESWLLILVE